MFGVQLICGLVLVLDAEPVLGARSSCVFGTQPVLGIRVWREARFWSRVARAREEFEFVSRNARDIMRGTQRIIKPPSYLGYNSDYYQQFSRVFPIPAGLKWKTC